MFYLDPNSRKSVQRRRPRDLRCAVTAGGLDLVPRFRHHASRLASADELMSLLQGGVEAPP